MVTPQPSSVGSKNALSYASRTRLALHFQAYSGVKMRLFGWSRPVVVAMAGMNIPESVPLPTNHVNDTLCRVGVVTATKGTGGAEKPFVCQIVLLPVVC